MSQITVLMGIDCIRDDNTTPTSVMRCESFPFGGCAVEGFQRYAPSELLTHDHIKAEAANRYGSLMLDNGVFMQDKVYAANDRIIPFLSYGLEHKVNGTVILQAHPYETIISFAGRSSSDIKKDLKRELGLGPWLIKLPWVTGGRGVFPIQERDADPFFELLSLKEKQIVYDETLTAKDQSRVSKLLDQLKGIIDSDQVWEWFRNDHQKAANKSGYPDTSIYSTPPAILAQKLFKGPSQGIALGAAHAAVGLEYKGTADPDTQRKPTTRMIVAVTVNRNIDDEHHTYSLVDIHLMRMADGQPVAYDKLSSMGDGSFRSPSVLSYGDFSRKALISDAHFCAPVPENLAVKMFDLIKPALAADLRSGLKFAEAPLNNVLHRLKHGNLATRVATLSIIEDRQLVSRDYMDTSWESSMEGRKIVRKNTGGGWTAIIPDIVGFLPDLNPKMKIFAMNIMRREVEDAGTLDKTIITPDVTRLLLYEIASILKTDGSREKIGALRFATSILPCADTADIKMIMPLLLEHLDKDIQQGQKLRAAILSILKATNSFSSVVSASCFNHLPRLMEDHNSWRENQELYISMLEYGLKHGYIRRETVGRKITDRLRFSHILARTSEQKAFPLVREHIEDFDPVAYIKRHLAQQIIPQHGRHENYGMRELEMTGHYLKRSSSAGQKPDPEQRLRDALPDGYYPSDDDLRSKLLCLFDTSGAEPCHPDFDAA